MWVKILLLFFVFSFLFRTDHSFDQDLGRHIKIGEIIVQSHQIPKTNLFSYTNADFPFINTHWLFEVLAYFFAQANALQVLLILKVIIFLFSVWLVLKIIPSKNQALLLPLGFIFLHTLRERLELRPEIFSFLFTSVTYYILEKYIRGPTKLIFLLPLIQLIWINTHIYFFVGLVLQAIFLIYIGYRYLRFHSGIVNLKIFTIIFALSVLVSFINPNGILGVLYPLSVTKNYGYTIVENQTMFLLESIHFRDPNFLWVKISAGLIILSFVFATLSIIKNLKNKNATVKNILLSLFGLTLALLNVRSFPYLVFISLPAVLTNFDEIKKNFLSKLLIIFFTLLLLLESLFYLNGDYYKSTDSQQQVNFKITENGKEALDFVLKNNLEGPIFNNFDIGSYIISRGYPKLKVFVDGRPEAYPAQYFSGVYIPSQSDYKNFKEIEKIYQLKTIIFSHTDQTPWGKTFLQSIIKDPDWRIVYIDNFIIILTKAEIVDQNKLAIIDLSKLNPSNFKFDNSSSYLRLGLFLLNSQNIQSGRQFIEKSLQLNPQSPAANSIMASFYSQSPNILDQSLAQTFQQKSKNIFFW